MSITKNGLIGFVIGDAMGVPIEFVSRTKLQKEPVTTMQGYGSYFDIPEGTWSDDTAMTLATLDSLIECESINYKDMADKFLNWIDHAQYTATNKVFDIGITTKYALARYKLEKLEPTLCGGTKISENGNGSLMRMLPIALYTYYKKLDDEEIITIVKNTSSITHAHEISHLGCYIYVKYIHYLLTGSNKVESYQQVSELNYEKYFTQDSINEYQRILKNNIQDLSIDDIISSGYVRHTLESVLWTILTTDNYKDAIIKAINLGEDTDTIGAITGSIAGLIYGYDTFPKELLSKLRRLDYLEELSNNFEQVFKN